MSAFARRRIEDALAQSEGFWRRFHVAPPDYAWQWPATFIEINVARLQELGRITEAEDPQSWFTTPMFLEIVTRRE